MSSNLPPDVTESMIPGNRPEDTEWERFLTWLDDIAIRYRLTSEDLKRYIEAGIYDEFKDIVNK